MNHDKNDNKGGFVSWTVFTWLATGLIASIGYVGTISMAAQQRADAANERVSAVEGDLKAINVKLDSYKEDFIWIRNKLEKDAK